MHDLQQTAAALAAAAEFPSQQALLYAHTLLNDAVVEFAAAAGPPDVPPPTDLVVLRPGEQPTVATAQRYAREAAQAVALAARTDRPAAKVALLIGASVSSYRGLLAADWSARQRPTVPDDAEAVCAR